MPAISGSGVAWLTVHVQARDAATHQPIPGATVTLMPEHRTQNPERRVSSPTVLTSQTDSNRIVYRIYFFEPVGPLIFLYRHHYNDQTILLVIATGATRVRSTNSPKLFFAPVDVNVRILIPAMGN